MAQRYIYTLKGHDDNEATRNIRAASPTMEAGKMKEGGTRQI